MAGRGVGHGEAVRLFEGRLSPRIEGLGRGSQIATYQRRRGSKQSAVVTR